MDICHAEAGKFQNGTLTGPSGRRVGQVRSQRQQQEGLLRVCHSTCLQGLLAIAPAVLGQGCRMTGRLVLNSQAKTLDIDV